MDALADNWSDFREAWECVNTLQEVPWQINQKVLDVANYLWDKNIFIAGLPRKSKATVPPYPIALEFKADGKMTKESRKS